MYVLLLQYFASKVDRVGGPVGYPTDGCAHMLQNVHIESGFVLQFEVFLIFDQRCNRCKSIFISANPKTSE